MSDLLSDELREMAKGLINTYNVYYQLIKPEVGYIIKNNIRDKKTIESTFDKILNIPTDEGYELLVIFCDYVAQFNKPLADDYLNLFKEFYGDDEPTNGITRNGV